MPNERIAFTSFIAQRVPAVARWQEREAEILDSPVEQDYASPVPDLARRGRTDASTLPAPLIPIASRPAAKPHPFNQAFTVWRLISANNREIARGAGMYADYAEAAAHAQRVRDAAPLLTVTFIRRTGRGEYGWYASFGKCPVLLAAAWHRTARDRDRSAATALQALGGAKILATAARHGLRHLAGVLGPRRRSWKRSSGRNPRNFSCRSASVHLMTSVS